MKLHVQGECLLNPANFRVGMVLCCLVIIYTNLQAAMFSEYRAFCICLFMCLFM